MAPRRTKIRQTPKLTMSDQIGAGNPVDAAETGNQMAALDGNFIEREITEIGVLGGARMARQITLPMVPVSTPRGAAE